MCRNAAEWSCPCKTKPVAVIVTRRVAVTVTRPVAVTVTIPVAVTVTRPVAVMQVQVHADEGCGLPVQAPQPVVLAHVTAAMRGATPQQVIVAIMKYRKFRSMLACITFLTILKNGPSACSETTSSSTSYSMVFMQHPRCIDATTERASTHAMPSQVE